MLIYPEKLLKFVDEDVASVFNEYKSLEASDVIMCQIAKYLKETSIQIKLLRETITQNCNASGNASGNSNENI
jgi:hypothetical protein